MDNMSDITKLPYQQQTVAHSSLDQAPFLTLSLRLHGHTFRLSLREARFSRSPGRLAEFHAFLAAFTGRSTTVGVWGALFDWATAPLRPRLDELAPPPPPPPMAHPTLQDYVAGPDYRCEIGAVDEELVVESVEVADRSKHFWLMAGGDCNREIVRKDLIRTIAPSDAAILPAAPDALDRPCELVSVGGHEFRFEKLDDVCVTEMMNTYEKIALANFPPHIHVRRLEGVVFDEQDNMPLGSLFSTKCKEPLAYARYQRDKVPLATKRRWISQVREAVAALHAAGIVWAGVSALNVYVDTEDDIWIGGFGCGWYSDWVDEDKVDEPEGDLQGLEALVNWILGLDEGPVPSKL